MGRIWSLSNDKFINITVITAIVTMAVATPSWTRYVQSARHRTITTHKADRYLWTYNRFFRCRRPVSSCIWLICRRPPPPFKLIWEFWHEIPSAFYYYLLTILLLFAAQQEAIYRFFFLCSKAITEKTFWGIQNNVFHLNIFLI